tara:strand:- start:4328 stop:5542 length:1215 start_codon:yes stop_codon:yes gene_type:complete
MKLIKKLIKKELRYGAHNYKSLPVVIKEAKGIYMYDVTNKKYFDFLSCYSAVNQGHCHPRIIKTLTDQSSKLTLTSRAYYNNKLGDYMKYITKLFNYQRVLPMNTGVEASETAIKLARCWGYKKKGIPNNEAVVLFAENNFWGRSIAACSSSSDPSCYENFGPYTPGFKLIPYNDTQTLESVLEDNPNIVAFMIEPIQGEAGIIVPNENYLKNVSNICRKYNVLFIADEIQSGLGRSGKMLACDYEDVKPDILCLGKALSAGVYPVSAVLADNHIMNCITPGTHGSTYGGNPLGSAIAKASLDVLIEENMIENSYKMGLYFRENLKKMYDCNSPLVNIRGKGLFNSIELDGSDVAEKLSYELLKNGLLSKTTHGNKLRLCPPLCINVRELDECLDIIQKAIRTV